MKMKKPPHPGRIVKAELEHLNLTVTRAAMVLGVNRITLSNLINCKSGISPEMAIRLSKVLGSSPDVWLGIQMKYDLAQAEKKSDQIIVDKSLIHA